MQLKRPAVRALALWVLALLVMELAGCSPALDWREVRIPGSQALALMPCRPAEQQRQIPLAGAPTTVTLQACSAGGLTWALVSADVADPARVGPALDELRTSSARNLRAAAPAGAAFVPPGSTPNPGSRRSRLGGTLPDGSAAQMEAAVFSHGTWVFQATVLGEKAEVESADTFLAGLRIAS
jgi:hypothetical protein